MSKAIFSRHLSIASELLVVADIKPGFIPVRRTITYSKRLRQLLALLKRVGLLPFVLYRLALGLALLWIIL